MYEPGICHRCMGLKVVVLGLLLLANKYFLNLDWWLFIGALLVVGGVLKMVMPHCPCGVPCAACGAGAKAAKPAMTAKPARKK